MRRGFTLIECLMVVAILGVLACLLAPAIVAAQQRARQMQCANNMKQIGLALQNYHATYDCFPMSTATWSGHSYLASILPFMEQTAVFNAYNFDLENWNGANATVVQVRIAVFLCPAHPDKTMIPAAEIRTVDGNAYPGQSKFAKGHYGANWGGDRAGWGSDFAKENGTFRGVLIPLPSRGPKGPNTVIGLKDITDGTSNTIAVGEKWDSQGWCVGGWASSEFDPGPSPVYQGDGPIARRVFTGSPHAAGPNFAFCDGSVRPLPASTGRKPWYALLTRDGNEPVSFERPSGEKTPDR